MAYWILVLVLLLPTPAVARSICFPWPDAEQTKLTQCVADHGGQALFERRVKEMAIELCGRAAERTAATAGRATRERVSSRSRLVAHLLEKRSMVREFECSVVHRTQQTQ